MSERYQPYPDYKYSDIERIGMLPVEWELNRLKFRTSIVTNKATSKTNPIALENISSWNGKYIPSDSEFEGDGVTFQPGDILFGKLRPYLAKVYLTAIEGEAVGDFHVLRPQKMVGRYLQYQMLTLEFISLVDGSTYGAKMPRASWEFMSNMGISCPSSDEQEIIANFLDHETAKIDTLIDKQQQLIKLLKEKRQAVVSHAVTKGLNPAAPMKDSGVEWLGEVPKHWGIALLKYFWTVLDCKHITAEFIDDGIPLASIKEVKSWIVDLSDAKKTTEKYYELLIEGNRKPQFGDIIYSRNATVGEAALVPEDIKFAMGQDVCLLKKQTKFNSEYFLHQLNSSAVKLQLESLLIGSTFKRINVEEIRNYWVASPPNEEQDEIADFLQSKSNRYDQLIKKAETAITLMQERRTALISAAVTGKIDVRNWHPAPSGIPMEVSA